MDGVSALGRGIVNLPVDTTCIIDRPDTSIISPPRSVKGRMRVTSTYHEVHDRRRCIAFVIVMVVLERRVCLTSASLRPLSNGPSRERHRLRRYGATYLPCAHRLPVDHEISDIIGYERLGKLGPCAVLCLRRRVHLHATAT